MSTSEQNPHWCMSGTCILLVPGVATGQHTQGPCRCMKASSQQERMRVEKGIRWLAERIGAIEALSTLSPFEREVLGAVHSLHDEYAPVEMTVTFKDIREHVGVSKLDPTGILEVNDALKRLESRGWIHEDIGVYEPIDKKC